MWTKVLALVIVLAGCSGTSETGTPATGLGDASAPSDGSAGVDAASAEGAGACADCKALPVAGAADAPTLVSATIKIPSVALPSDDQKIFYEFVITDPQGVADIQNLKIDEFDSPEGLKVSSSATYSCSTNVNDDCTISGSNFIIYRPSENIASLRTAKTWPLRLTAIDTGHATTAKVYAEVFAR